MLRETLDLIRSGLFSPDDVHRFEPIVDSLLYGDEYLLLADYASYIESQKRVNQTYLDAEMWSRKSILTVARMGKFSSDRSIKEYCDLIWKVRPVHIDLDSE
jgi:starch phosphorylase